MSPIRVHSERETTFSFALFKELCQKRQHEIRLLLSDSDDTLEKFKWSFWTISRFWYWEISDCHKKLSLFLFPHCNSVHENSSQTTFLYDFWLLCNFLFCHLPDMISRCFRNTFLTAYHTLPYMLFEFCEVGKTSISSTSSIKRHQTRKIKNRMFFL